MNGHQSNNMQVDERAHFRTVATQVAVALLAGSAFAAVLLLMLWVNTLVGGR
jgi:hypothetical protein